jgi:predicted DNA-binding transcriptional regulator AlpA
MHIDLFKTNGSSPPSKTQPQAGLGPQNDEVWTVADVARHLKMSPRQVWELTRRRGQLRSDHPIPHIKIHRKALRFRKSDVQQWLATLAQKVGAQ